MEAVIFDFDGTLTQERKGVNSWNLIWKYIDDMQKYRALLNQYISKEFDVKTWLKLTIERFKDKGVRREYLTQIARDIKLMPGTHATLRELYENGIKIFVLSGGVKQIIGDVLKNDGVERFFTDIQAYNMLFDKNGELLGCDSPEHNVENKNEFIDIVKQKYRLRSEDILFVGNSSNDEKAYLSGVRTLCINPDGTNGNDKGIWNGCIENCENLKEILKFCEIPRQK